MFLNVLKDSLLDSLKMLPFLLVTYIFIELIERKASFAKHGKFLNGRFAPVYGALAGIFPQCGISVMSAKLYEKNLIRTGTLFAVFISTSDEAFTVLLAGDKRIMLIPLLILKFVTAVIVGEIVNAILKNKEISYCKTDMDFTHEEICAHCHEYEKENPEGKYGNFKKFFIFPFLHSLQTLAFIFAVFFAFGFLFGENGLIGAAEFNIYISKISFFEPFLTSLIGLIPNCASSALLSAAYVQGAISFGSLFAGLSVNAGVGMAILFKNTKKWKRNLGILSSLYLIGSILGVFIVFIMNLF